MANSAAEQLYLFSSNIRPRYEQDIVDVLGAPPESLFRFRYQSSTGRDYLAQGLPERWRNNQLSGLRVLVCFSIQQEEAYHPSAFLPVRYGTVRRTWNDGSLHTVEFEPGEFISLGATLDRGERVRNFSKTLKNTLGETPDERKSAVLGPPVGGLHFGDLVDPLAWEEAVDYLARTLSFRDHVFLRFAGLREAGKSADVVFDDGIAQLVAGRSYELRLTHLQPRELSPKCLKVVADGEIASVTGKSALPISSRYDTVPVFLHALDRVDVRETTVLIGPEAGTNGSNVELRVRVSANQLRQAGGAIGGAASLLLIAMPGIVSSSVSGWTRVLIAATGFGLGAVLLFFRWRRS